MIKKRYSEQQIVCALKQAELVEKGLAVGELRRLKDLEEENRGLKGLVADLSLDKQILQDVLSKKL